MSVGLDIGSKTIKVVELARDGKKFRLKSAGAVGYSGPSVEHMSDDREMATLASIVQKLFSDAKISSRDVSISIPESQAFTRTLRFPLLTDEEIASAVKWEAEEYIPIPIAEAVVQHQILERRENTSPPQVSVLLIAAPKALIEKYMKILSIAKLNVSFVETSLMSIARSLAPIDQTAILIDFGATATNLGVTKNGQLQLSRTIQSGGDAFTRAIAQGLNVSLQQAEEYKKTYGLSDSQLEGKVAQSLDPLFKNISEEIKKIIHFYQIEEKGQTPTSVIISGGSAGLVEIAPVLTKLLSVEILLGNPFTNVSLDDNAAKSLAGFSPLYAVAAGLAMR